MASYHEFTCLLCGREARRPKRGGPKPKHCSKRCAWDAKVLSVDAGFWARVTKDGPVPAHAPELGACWTWSGYRNRLGYGVSYCRGRQYTAHRRSWEIANGQIPAGLHVMHRCDNRACVRPGHLALGTHRDNMRDMVAKGRAARTCGDLNGSRLYPERLRRGVAIRAAKLCDADVMEIRELLAKGFAKKSIAGRFQVDPAVIWRISTGRGWKHV